MTARVALLVVSYGSTAMVEDNLALTALPEGAITVVVDNFTTDAERALARDTAERCGWHLVAPARNLGFGAGINAAAEAARDLGAEVYVMLNPDAYLPGDGVGELAERVQAAPMTMVAPLVRRPDGSHFSSLMELDLATGSMRRVDGARRYERSALWISGACFAVTRELWDAVGGFDDDYFLYWEDIDLSVRVERVGGALRVDEDIVAIHSAGGTQSEDGTDRVKSPIYYYYNVRNRYVFAAQHLTAQDRRQWTRRAVPAAWDILLRGGRRQMLHPSKNLVPAFRGTASGFAYIREHGRA